MKTADASPNRLSGTDPGLVEDDYSHLSSIARLVIRSVERYWWYIPAAIVVTLLVAIIWLRFSPSVYAAKVTFTQRESSTNNLGEVNSLAQTFGLGRLGGSSNDTMEIYTTLLTDPSLMHYLADHDPSFLPLLFPGQWDSKTKTWHAPHGLVPMFTGLLKMAAGFDAWRPPSPVKAAASVEGLLQVSEARQTGFRTVEIDDGDRDRAIKLLEMLSRGADSLVRERERQKSERRVDYLRHELSIATDLAMREALGQLLEREERNLMLTRIDQYYSITIVSAPEVYATPPGKRMRPAFVVSIVLGTVFGMLLAIWRHIGRPAWPFWR